MTRWLRDGNWIGAAIVVVLVALVVGIFLAVTTAMPPSHGDVSLPRAKEQGAAAIANSGIPNGQNVRLTETVKSSYAGTAAWRLRYEAPGRRALCVWVWRIRTDFRSATGSCS